MSDTTKCINCGQPRGAHERLRAARCPVCGGPMKGWADGGWCDQCGAAFGENADEDRSVTVVLPAGQVAANCLCGVEGKYGPFTWCPAHPSPAAAPTREAASTQREEPTASSLLASYADPRCTCNVRAQADTCGMACPVHGPAAPEGEDEYQLAQAVAMARGVVLRQAGTVGAVRAFDAITEKLLARLRALSSEIATVREERDGFAECVVTALDRFGQKVDGTDLRDRAQEAARLIREGVRR